MNKIIIVKGKQVKTLLGWHRQDFVKVNGHQLEGSIVSKRQKSEKKPSVFTCYRGTCKMGVDVDWLMGQQPITAAAAVAAAAPVRPTSLKWVRTPNVNYYMRTDRGTFYITKPVHIPPTPLHPHGRMDRGYQVTFGNTRIPGTFSSVALAKQAARSFYAQGDSAPRDNPLPEGARPALVVGALLTVTLGAFLIIDAMKKKPETQPTQTPIFHEPTTIQVSSPYGLPPQHQTFNV